MAQEAGDSPATPTALKMAPFSKQIMLSIAFELNVIGCYPYSLVLHSHNLRPSLSSNREVAMQASASYRNGRGHHQSF